jgi:hypothetical protein
MSFGSKLVGGNSENEKVAQLNKTFSSLVNQVQKEFDFQMELEPDDENVEIILLVKDNTLKHLLDAKMNFVKLVTF